MVPLPFPPHFSSSQQMLWLYSALSGIFMCRIVYELTGFISLRCFKGYAKLSDAQKVEWSNRGFSTFHALVVASASLYLLLFSDLFDKDSQDVLIVHRNSTVSNCVLGISIGYFVADLAMILWQFPALGGLEYVARILLFIFFFSHMVIHFDEVKQIFPLGFYSLLTVPPILGVMNVFWFWKIVKGLIKTISKSRHRE
ncbi:hypothetical protein Tsubulata_025333 [Turnera subulata]|uniref:TLC domain-containing protein n=1 Tax=Turnera subulata TaxID=218843 RepID=A0A9Q0FG96_9ROSI|nr:hypothetical protein Tsubulata_025333 [Turnera subulata]